jgi:ABC-type proline/glycine betaine transport system substrate-binding protein
MKSLKALLALLMAFALFATACGSDDAVETVDAGTETTEDTTEEAPADDSPAAQPGEGVEVTMARADWTTGYFQAEVYKLMLEELGFTVSQPSELEISPSLAYLAMSQGDIDFWVNSWYPGHNSWLEAERPDGSKAIACPKLVNRCLLAAFRAS